MKKRVSGSIIVASKTVGNIRSPDEYLSMPSQRTMED